MIVPRQFVGSFNKQKMRHPFPSPTHPHLTVWSPMDIRVRVTESASPSGTLVREGVAWLKPVSFFFSSEEVCKRGFTVIVDMRGSKWDSIKPLLKILQESFPCCIHVALIIKPDNFWQKQRTNFGSSKFEFEVTSMCSQTS